MTWTTPKTWVVGEALTASDLNTHLKDNLEALKAPPTAHYEGDEATNYATTSGGFVDVDGTNLALSIETTGGDVVVGFVGVFGMNATGENVYLDIHENLDYAGNVGGDGGIATIRFDNAVVRETLSFAYLVTGLSAGTHVFKLRWKVSGNTATLFAGAGTSGYDMHPQFWVREI